MCGATANIRRQKVHMHTRPARAQAWLADLASIQAEIAARDADSCNPGAGKRTRKLKPLWEE